MGAAALQGQRHASIGVKRSLSEGGTVYRSARESLYNMELSKALFSVLNNYDTVVSKNKSARVDTTQGKSEGKGTKLVAVLGFDLFPFRRCTR